MRFIFNIKIIVVLSAGLLLSCVTEENCGSGDYKCFDLKSTYPSELPVFFDDFADAILYADGKLEMFGDSYNYNNPDEYDLKVICDCDTVLDVIFYDKVTPERNGYSSFDDVDIINPPCLFILSSQKCCRWNIGDSEVFEFAYSGPDSTMLINPSSLNVDFQGYVHITDPGDGSVKIYNYNGVFTGLWSGIDSADYIQFYQDYAYILQRRNNSITRYDRLGNYVNTIINNYSPFPFDRILCFNVESESSIWISHDNGKIITRINLDGDVLEEKLDYCYFDITFEFMKVIHISIATRGIYVVDSDARYIIMLDIPRGHAI